MNLEYKDRINQEINEYRAYRNTLREDIMRQLGLLLACTDEEHPYKYNITLRSGRSYGVSPLYFPTITSCYISGQCIYFNFEDKGYSYNFHDIDTEDLIAIFQSLFNHESI